MHKNTAMRLDALLPANVPDASFDSLTGALRMYLPVIADNDDGPDIDNVHADFIRWQSRWQDVAASEWPSDCLLALAACNQAFYPHIHALLQISASLPVSTATPERTFSAVKIIKTYLCSKLTDENMQGFVMAYIHNDIPIDIDKVIDHFALKNWRLQYFVYACKVLLNMIAITVLTVYHCSFNHSGGMTCHDVFWLYGRLGRAAEREWAERNATDWRTPCRKFLATPLAKNDKSDSTQPYENYNLVWHASTRSKSETISTKI